MFPMPLLERRCVMIEPGGLVMTVAEYDKVQRRAPDRPPWAQVLPRWAPTVPPVHQLTADPADSSGAYVFDTAAYDAQMLRLLGLA